MDNPKLSHIPLKVFDDLVTEIVAGRCVAFVGAGFSADAEGSTWGQLVEDIIARLERRNVITLERAEVAQKYVKNGDYDKAVGVALHEMEHEDPEELLARIVRTVLGGSETTTKRDQLLTGIPFQAVLTTNYDGRPSGQSRGAGAYRDILRGIAGSGGLWDHANWNNNSFKSNTIALHGRLDDSGNPPLVLTPRHYRDLLYRSPGYQTFLKSLFATSTILFLGKSFDDEYINELRSEIMALFENELPDRPIAYAVIHAAEFDELEQKYLRASEGIQLLRYGREGGGNDHAGFDALLEELHSRTNFFRVMQTELAGLGILWLDSNEMGTWGDADVRRIIEAIEDGSADISVERVSTLEAALERLRRSSVDIMITNWGHVHGSQSLGTTILDSVHEGRHRTPVIVFAAPGEFVETNRATAIRAGAYAFETTYDKLFRKIYEVAKTLNSASL